MWVFFKLQWHHNVQFYLRYPPLCFTVSNFTLSIPHCVSFCFQNIENGFKVKDNNWGSYCVLHVIVLQMTPLIRTMFLKYSTTVN